VQQREGGEAEDETQDEHWSEAAVANGERCGGDGRSAARSDGGGTNYAGAHLERQHRQLVEKDVAQPAGQLSDCGGDAANFRRK
jgi:hypothetical protein